MGSGARGGRSNTSGGKSRPTELFNPYRDVVGDMVEGNERWALRSRAARGLLAGGMAAGVTVLLGVGAAHAEDAPTPSQPTVVDPAKAELDAAREKEQQQRQGNNADESLSAEQRKRKNEASRDRQEKAVAEFNQQQAAAAPVAAPDPEPPVAAPQSQPEPPVAAPQSQPEPPVATPQPEPEPPVAAPQSLPEPQPQVAEQPQQETRPETQPVVDLAKVELDAAREKEQQQRQGNNADESLSAEQRKRKNEASRDRQEKAVAEYNQQQAAAQPQPQVSLTKPVPPAQSAETVQPALPDPTAQATEVQPTEVQPTAPVVDASKAELEEKRAAERARREATNADESLTAEQKQRRNAASKERQATAVAEFHEQAAPPAQTAPADPAAPGTTPSAATPTITPAAPTSWSAEQNGQEHRFGFDPTTGVTTEQHDRGDGVVNETFTADGMSTRTFTQADGDVVKTTVTEDKTTKVVRDAEGNFKNREVTDGQVVSTPTAPPTGTPDAPAPAAPAPDPTTPQQSVSFQNVDGETTRNTSYDAATDTTVQQFRQAHNDALVTDTYKDGTRIREIRRPNGNTVEERTDAEGVTRSVVKDKDGNVVSRDKEEGAVPVAPVIPPTAPATADTDQRKWTATDPNAALVDYVDDPLSGATLAAADRTDGGAEQRRWNADGSYTSTRDYRGGKQVVTSVDETGAKHTKVYRDGELTREATSQVAPPTAPPTVTPEQLAQASSTTYVTGNGERAVQDVLVDTSRTDATVTETGVDVRRTVAENGAGLTVRDNGKATTYREVAPDGTTTVRRINDATGTITNERTVAGEKATPITLPAYVQNDPAPTVTTSTTPAGQDTTTTTWSDGTTLAESSTAGGDVVIQTSLPTGVQTTQRRDVNGDVVTMQKDGSGPTELSTRDSAGAGVQQVLRGPLADLPIAAVEVGETGEKPTDVTVKTKNGTETATFGWGDNAVTVTTGPDGTTTWKQRADQAGLEALNPDPNQSAPHATEDGEQHQVEWDRWGITRKVDPAGELTRRVETRVGDGGESRADGEFAVTKDGSTESSWKARDADGRQLTSLDVGADGSVRQVTDLNPDFGPRYRNVHRKDAEGNADGVLTLDETDIGNGTTRFKTREEAGGEGYVQLGRQGNGEDAMRVVYTDVSDKYDDGRPTLTDEQKKALAKDGYVIANAVRMPKGKGLIDGTPSQIMVSGWEGMQLGDGLAEPPSGIYAKGTGSGVAAGSDSSDGQDGSSQGVLPDQHSSGAASTVTRWAGSRIAQGFGADGLAASTVGNGAAALVGLASGDKNALRTAGGAIADEVVTDIVRDALPADLGPGATAAGNVVNALVTRGKVDVTHDLVAPVGQEIITDLAGAPLGYAGGGALRLAGDAIFGGKVTGTQVVDEALASGAGAACSAAGTPVLGAACYGAAKLIAGLIGRKKKPDDLAEDFSHDYAKHQNLTRNPMSEIVDDARAGGGAHEELWKFTSKDNLLEKMAFNPDQPGTTTRQAYLATSDPNTTKGPEAQRREDYGALAATLAKDTPELEPFAEYMKESAAYKQRSAGRSDQWHERNFEKAVSRLGLNEEFGVEQVDSGAMNAAQARAIVDESGGRLGYQVYNPLSGDAEDPTALGDFTRMQTDKAAAKAAAATPEDSQQDGGSTAAPAAKPSQYAGKWWKDFYRAQADLASKKIADVVPDNFGGQDPNAVDNYTDDEIYAKYLRSTYVGLDGVEGDTGAAANAKRKADTREIIQKIRQFGVDDPAVAAALIGDGLSGLESPAYEAPKKAPLIRQPDPSFDVADGIASVITSGIDAVDSLTGVGDKTPAGGAAPAEPAAASSSTGAPQNGSGATSSADPLHIPGVDPIVIPRTDMPGPDVNSPHLTTTSAFGGTDPQTTADINAMAVKAAGTSDGNAKPTPKLTQKPGAGASTRNLSSGANAGSGFLTSIDPLQLTENDVPAGMASGDLPENLGPRELVDDAGRFGWTDPQTMAEIGATGADAAPPASVTAINPDLAATLDGLARDAGSVPTSSTSGDPTAGAGGRITNGGGAAPGAGAPGGDADGAGGVGGARTQLPSLDDAPVTYQYTDGDFALVDGLMHGRPAVQLQRDGTGMPTFTVIGSPGNPNGPIMDVDTGQIGDGGSPIEDIAMVSGGATPVRTVEFPGIPVTDEALDRMQSEQARRDAAGAGTFTVTTPEGQDLRFGEVDLPTASVLDPITFTARDVVMPPRPGQASLTCIVENGDCTTAYTFDDAGNVSVTQQKIDADGAPVTTREHRVAREPNQIPDSLPTQSGTWIFDGADGAFVWVPGLSDSNDSSTVALQLQRGPDGELLTATTTGGAFPYTVEQQPSPGVLDPDTAPTGRTRVWTNLASDLGGGPGVGTSVAQGRGYVLESVNDPAFGGPVVTGFLNGSVVPPMDDATTQMFGTLAGIPRLALPGNVVVDSTDPNANVTIRNSTTPELRVDARNSMTWTAADGTVMRIDPGEYQPPAVAGGVAQGTGTYRLEPGGTWAPVDPADVAPVIARGWPSDPPAEDGTQPGGNPGGGSPGGDLPPGDRGGRDGPPRRSGLAPFLSLSDSADPPFLQSHRSPSLPSHLLPNGPHDSVGQPEEPGSARDPVDFVDEWSRWNAALDQAQAAETSAGGNGLPPVSPPPVAQLPGDEEPDSTSSTGEAIAGPVGGVNPGSTTTTAPTPRATRVNWFPSTVGVMLGTLTMAGNYFIHSSLDNQRQDVADQKTALQQHHDAAEASASAQLREIESFNTEVGNKDRAISFSLRPIPDWAANLTDPTVPELIAEGRRERVPATQILDEVLYGNNVLLPTGESTADVALRESLANITAASERGNQNAVQVYLEQKKRQDAQATADQQAAIDSAVRSGLFNGTSQQLADLTRNADTQRSLVEGELTPTHDLGIAFVGEQNTPLMVFDRDGGLKSRNTLLIEVRGAVPGAAGLSDTELERRFGGDVDRAVQRQLLRVDTAPDVARSGIGSAPSTGSFTSDPTVFDLAALVGEPDPGTGSAGRTSVQDGAPERTAPQATVALPNGVGYPAPPVVGQGDALYPANNQVELRATPRTGSPVWYPVEGAMALATAGGLSYQLLRQRNQYQEAVRQGRRVQVTPTDATALLTLLIGFVGASQNVLTNPLRDSITNEGVQVSQQQRQLSNGEANRDAQTQLIELLQSAQRDNKMVEVAGKDLAVLFDGRLADSVGLPLDQVVEQAQSKLGLTPAQVVAQISEELPGTLPTPETRALQNTATVQLHATNEQVYNAAFASHLDDLRSQDSLARQAASQRLTRTIQAAGQDQGELIQRQNTFNSRRGAATTANSACAAGASCIEVNGVQVPVVNRGNLTSPLPTAAEAAADVREQYSWLVENVPPGVANAADITDAELEQLIQQEYERRGLQPGTTLRETPGLGVDPLSSVPGENALPDPFRTISPEDRATQERQFAIYRDRRQPQAPSVAITPSTHSAPATGAPEPEPVADGLVAPTGAEDGDGRNLAIGGGLVFAGGTTGLLGRRTSGRTPSSDEPNVESGDRAEGSPGPVPRAPRARTGSGGGEVITPGEMAEQASSDELADRRFPGGRPDQPATQPVAELPGDRWDTPFGPNDLNRGRDVPVEVAQESFPSDDSELERVLKPNGPAGPDFTFPLFSEEAVDGPQDGVPSAPPVAPSTVAQNGPAGPAPVTIGRGIPTQPAAMPEGLVTIAESPTDVASPAITLGAGPRVRPGATRTNSRTGQEETLVQSFALRGDGGADVERGRVLVFADADGNRSAVVDPASTVAPDGKTEVVYLPRFSGGVVAASNPAAGQVAQEVTLPSGASSSPIGFEAVTVRQGTSTQQLSGIPGGSAGSVTRAATKDPTVERVTVVPSELRSGYYDDGVVRSALVPVGSEGAFRSGQREFWVAAGTRLVPVWTEVEATPAPAPAPFVPQGAGTPSPALTGEPADAAGTAGPERRSAPVVRPRSEPVSSDPVEPVQRDSGSGVPGWVGPAAGAAAGAAGALWNGLQFLLNPLNGVPQSAVPADPDGQDVASAGSGDNSM